jgi:hypothetical protein
MFSIAIFGRNTVDGSMLEPGERVISLALFGGIELDFSAAPPPPAIDVIIIAVFGGTTVKVRPDEQVTLSGVSLFGARRMEPMRQSPRADSAQPSHPVGDTEGFPLPLEIAAFSLFGAVRVERQEQPDL